jgi:membrane protein DedA with SNARE-associated domain
MMAMKLHTGLEGYLLLSGWVFAEQIGLPLPAAPILVAAGALAATGSQNFALVISAALSASLLADYLWYRAGAFRQSVIQRFKSRHPDSRVLRNAERLIKRYGSRSLIFAKFIPGMSLAAPPLSGAYGITLTEFLLFDALGSLIWSASLVGIGYFSVSRIKIGFIPVSSVTYLLICGAAVIGFAATKFARPAWNYLSKPWREAAVARFTKEYTEAPPRLEWLTSQITGGVVSEPESALESLVPKEGDNATFARWIRAWSRKLAIARALGTVAGELKSSARRMELVDSSQLRKLVGCNWRCVSSINRVELERGIAAIDLFPRSALILTIFEKLSLVDAAILLGVPKETVANAQAIALRQLSRSLAGGQGWSNELWVQADPELKTCVQTA